MKRKTLALLLVVAIVMSLFAGQQYQSTKVQAAAEDEIVLGSLVKASEGTYYTYPNAEVKLADSTKAFHNLTITVDSGHIMTTATQIAGVTGHGVVSGADMNVGFTTLPRQTVTNQFLLIFPQEQENQMLKHLSVSFVLPHPTRYRKYRYVRRLKEQVRQQKLQ